jgi:hypothetical protein
MKSGKLLAVVVFIFSISSFSLVLAQSELMDSNFGDPSVLGVNVVDVNELEEYVYKPYPPVSNDLLKQYESNYDDFKGIQISNKIVYFYQRRIEEAIVERDFIVYHFDQFTKELLDMQFHWREELPETLPKVISQGLAESMVEGDIRFSQLFYISPESDVFPIRPAPKYPCWIIETLDEGKISVTVIDAVKGKIVGPGIPPPYTAFSLTGPIDTVIPGCSDGWYSWYENARDWFNTMGYTTEGVIWPTQDKMQSHIQSHETALFYELAHGGSQVFRNACEDDTKASDIETWIAGYSKMPFAFIGSCDGMCNTGNDTLSYEFRKGSNEYAVTVGYCGMSNSPCVDDCWYAGYTISWQTTLFDYMNEGWTVKAAFDHANTTYPGCAVGNCMRFAGDEGFRVIPLVTRDFTPCTDPCTLTISSTSDGTVTSPGEGQFQYCPGGVVPIIAQPNVNYHFVEWTGTAVDAGKVANPNAASTTVTVDADYTLVANFAINRRTLTISSTSGGVVTAPGEGSYTYDHGTVVPIIAQAEPDYHFVEWTGHVLNVDDPSDPNTTVTMGGSYTLVAYFVRTIIHVDASAPGPTHDGSSWTQAYLYLQDGLAAAGSGSEIWVAEGTYTPGTVRTDTFQLINGVVLYGGYEGGGADDPNERDIELYETILTGDLNGDDGPDFANNGDNSYHVVIGSGTDVTAVLDGFTITAGNANGVPEDGTNVGGGMFNDPCGSPTVNNCTISKNWGFFGGGMYNRDSSPTFTNCTFSGNSAGIVGGAMANEFRGSPTVTNCRFSGNSAGIVGGAMENYDYCSPTVTNCTFTGNSADNGGGMYNEWYSDPTVTNCIFWDNTASSGGNEIDNYESTPVISYCDITGSGGSSSWDTDLGSDGGDNIDADPLFVDPNGPDGITGTDDDILRLSHGSPCIDAGDSNSVPDDITTDLDGRPRRIDDPFTADGGNGSAPIVDMGAYEFSCGGDLDGDGQVDGEDFATLFSWWMETGCGEENDWCEWADSNQDGAVNMDDLLEVIINWLAGR